RGAYEISALSREKLKNPESIDAFITAELSKKRENKPNKANTIALAEISLTPQEELYASANKIREARYQELIDTSLSQKPREFENLVVLPLQKLGYGGELKQSGVVTSYTNDGGIDGIIKEDVLG